MHYVFSKSCKGYLHDKNGKPCQDYSASYRDPERIIITCCDGHGGPQYVRSQVGSKIASDAVIDVFRQINASSFLGKKKDKLPDEIKLLLLCEYNARVERELGRRPLNKKELIGLDEEQIDNLRLYPAKAFGTTLSGAMAYKNKIIVVCIGDTEALGLRRGELVRIFDNSDDPAANVTYSMCQEDAYRYLRVAILDRSKFDGILLCTDGLSSPFQSYENIHHSFIQPSVCEILSTHSTNSLGERVEKIATSLGVGDDVSVALFLDGQTKLRYYWQKVRRK